MQGNKDRLDKKKVILRQRSRLYLFSNSLAPAIVGASNKVFDILSDSTLLRDHVIRNAVYFRNKIKEYGFDIIEEAAIVSVMLYAAKIAQTMASKLLDSVVKLI